MSPLLLQRQTALAGVALLATLGALALAHRDVPAPSQSPVPEIRWESALVGVLGPADYVHRTACEITLDSGSLGVAHPQLPCGVDLVVSFGSKAIRTEVVARERVADGREFDLTKALADALGVHGTETIRWRFAR